MVIFYSILNETKYNSKINKNQIILSNYNDKKVKSFDKIKVLNSKWLLVHYP